MERIFAVGMDLGESAIHLVGMAEDGAVTFAEVLPTGDLEEALSRIGVDIWAAIDAPDEQRDPRHLEDLTLSPKFRPARCAEIALGEQRGYWVPWVTPRSGEVCPGWMKTGFETWRTTLRVGIRTIEVYPHAAFRVLAGGRQLAKKSTAVGGAMRIKLLERVGVSADFLAMWSHDSVDAAVAAVVARDARLGLADEVRCAQGDAVAHDGSAIWLPAARSG